MSPELKPRLLTGDTPTGRLHLGHWIGSVQTRVALQNSFDCYFILANLHAFTTCADQPERIRHHTLELALDYLAAGIDPEKSTIFIQSEIPAIAELTYWFSMLVPYSRVMRNPTLKEEIHAKGLGDHYSFGFMLYPVGQIADILAFRPTRVPVGEDQLPHIEMTNEVARRFNQRYCGVDAPTSDQAMVTQGGLFPIIQPEPIKAQRLVGIGPPNNATGLLPKMSKSLNNAIYLCDNPDTIQKKVMGMYTDPKRIHASDPGTIANNPLWIFQDAFNPDKAWVSEAKMRYCQGSIGDVPCKKRLIEVLVALTDPMRERRKQYATDPAGLLKLLRVGTLRAREQAEATLVQVKACMKQDYFL